MHFNIKHLIKISLFSTLLVLAQCSGDDGDPGPAGQNGTNGANGADGHDGTDGAALFTDKYGSITGTMTGITSQNKSFSEPFSFTMAKSKGGFVVASNSFTVWSSNGKYLSFERYQPDLDHWFSFEFDIDDKGKLIPNFIVFRNLKENAGSAGALYVSTTAIFEDMTIVWPIEPALNASTYHFDFEIGSFGYLSYKMLHDPERAVFKTTTGAEVMYNYFDGSFIQIHNADGSVNTSSATYGSLTFVSNSNTFMLGGNDLSSTETIPSDSFTYSNYSFDQATGALKFDFELTSSFVARDNASRHPLTISGKVDVIVYGDITSRKRG